MSDFRQIVREYVRASEVLLQLHDLSEHEQEAVSDMADRLNEKLANLKNNSGQ